MFCSISCVVDILLFWKCDFNILGKKPWSNFLMAVFLKKRVLNCLSPSSLSRTKGSNPCRYKVSKTETAPVCPARNWSLSTLARTALLYFKIPDAPARMSPVAPSASIQRKKLRSLGRLWTEKKSSRLFEHTSLCSSLVFSALLNRDVCPLTVRAEESISVEASVGYVRDNLRGVWSARFPDADVMATLCQCIPAV